MFFIRRNLGIIMLVLCILSVAVFAGYIYIDVLSQRSDKAPEFAFGEDPMFVRHVLGRISEKGLVPVLAHPERYFFVQQNPRMIYDWVMSGCVIQINKGSIIGRFGEDAAKTARLLVGHDLVHCVASDAHGTDVRTPVLSEAYDAICVNFGRECAKRLFYTNPAHIRPIPLSTLQPCSVHR